MRKEMGFPMKERRFLLANLFSALALLAAGTACNLNLATGLAGTPQVVVVMATDQAGGVETPDPAAPNDESAPALTPTITPTAPTMTAGQELSCVKGPHWIFYEWVTKIPEGETVTLLAKASEEWEEYYWVRKSDGTECWAFGGSSPKTGDLSFLPVREAPPLPEVTYTIENRTLLPVHGIFIREKDAADWGANKLTSPIPSGSMFSTTLTAGFYDVLVEDIAAGPLYEKHDWPIGSEASYRKIILNEAIDFYLQNNFAFDLCTFNLRPVDGSSWKTIHDEADGHIAPGGRLNFTILPGRYSLQVRQCGGGWVVNWVGAYFGPAVPGHNLG
jgi:hypothetical protein